MKKLLFMFVLACPVMITAKAQTKPHKTKVREAEVPVAVVDAFKKDYPGSQPEAWLLVPVTVVDKEYMISGKNIDNQKAGLYEVKFAHAHFREEAVYDERGKLLHAKEIIKDTALPTTVKTALSTKFPGFTVLKDPETIKEGNRDIAYYKVFLEKGKEKEWVAIDPDGNVLKQKRII